MIADFAIRLAGGLAFALLLTPWRLIPPSYFRTMSLVMVGASIVAAVDIGFVQGPSLPLGVAIVVAVLAFIASIAWGLGLARIGMALFLAVALFEAATIVSRISPPESVPAARLAIAIGSALTSGFLLGSSLAAMLLGHHYLTAPAMSISPLRRLVALAGIALAVRGVWAIAGLWSVWSAGGFTGTHRADLPVLIAMRIFVGIVAPALAIVLAWRTTLIRSTQSATGILYAGSTLILLGELAAQGLAHSAGMAI